MPWYVSVKVIHCTRFNMNNCFLTSNNVSDITQVEFLCLCSSLKILTLEGNPICTAPNALSSQEVGTKIIQPSASIYPAFCKPLVNIQYSGLHSHLRTLFYLVVHCTQECKLLDCFTWQVFSCWKVKKGIVCIRAERPIRPDPVLIHGFCTMKRLGIFPVPTEGVPVSIYATS